MARKAVQILLESAEGGEPLKRRVELATDLVVRESTAPPLGAAEDAVARARRHN
jgi:DNA-binding LacI/PurR family transcriptional regulator